MPRFRKGAGWYAAELRHPQLISTEQMIRRRAENSDPDADHGGGNDRGSRARAREQHWHLVDVAAMIIAALQVVLPIVLVLLAAAAGAYGLFMLAFG